MKWEKYVTRRIAVQVAQSWNFGWGEAMEKTYGFSMKNTLVFRDTKKTEYYYDKDLYDDHQKKLYNKIKDEEFLKTFHVDARNTIEDILSNTKDEFSVDLKNLDNQELLLIFKDFVLPNVEQFFVRMWTVMNVGRALGDVVPLHLKKYLDKERIELYLPKLSSPLIPNDVINERIDLLKIAIGKDAELEEHTAKYRHIPMYDFDHEPYNQEHFQKELTQIKNPDKESKEIEELFADRKSEFDQIVSEIKPDDYLLLLLEFLKENVWLRDYRDMIRQKLNLELRKFYTEVGLRLGLDIEEIVTLTNDEIIEYLDKNKKFPQEEIKKRNESFLLIQKGSEVQIFSGIEAIEMFKKEVKAKDLNEDQELKGIVASKGKVRGPVKIIYTNRDLKKIETGDIFVATMTRQDYLPAVRKCLALVTDEGSIACHSAIIARELKIPCVVALKIATQVLKDGDMVEVDANKGIVKKL